MSTILFECAVILVLLVVNGILAMTEIAVVASRRARLRQMADAGGAGAKIALQLAESPNRFLSTVQVGITLVGILAGAFGGATLSRELAGVIREVSWLAEYADRIAFFVVVAVITYLSLVIGELVPKRLGLSAPEVIAARMARPMHWLSRAASPLVAFLSGTTEGLLRLFGFKPGKEAVVSEEEVRVMMQEGLRAGAFNKVESEIIHSALDLDRLPVREIMTPRPKVIWLGLRDTHEQVWHKIVVSGHTHFPVYEDNRDNVVGIISIKAIYANLAASCPVEIKSLMTRPLIVPETQMVLNLVETFKQSGKHVAMVTDEFGVIVGLVTLNDVMEAVMGEFPSQGSRARPEIKARPDGTWLADAMIDLASVERALPGFTFGPGSRSDYQTLAGYVVKVVGHVPREGETLEAQGYIFEVLDMDRHRVDKVLITPASPKV